jgi:hypothetical protein|eukprot:COSAG06_NODE_2635_length_6539_cov_2.859161_2_plen_199_part_00
MSVRLCACLPVCLRVRFLCVQKVDITETCKPQSGWKSEKFFEFVKLHSAEARDLVGVGFLSGLTEDEAARRRRKWKAWYAGLSAAEKKARGDAISAGWTGKKRKNETKKRKKPKERKHTNEHKRKISGGLKGRKQMDEHVQRKVAATKHTQAKRSPEQWADRGRKCAATRRKNGTKTGPKKGGKVSEAESCAHACRPM